MRIDIADEKIELYFKELSELTIKYGIAIGACGCCNSPYLMTIDNKTNDPRVENIKWDCDINAYVYEK